MVIRVSKRVFLTLPDAIADALERWAEKDGGKAATLAGFLVEREVRAALQSGEIPPPETDPRPEPDRDETLKQVAKALSALADGQPLPRDVCVTELANALGVDAEVITKLWKRTNGNSKVH